MLAEIRPAFIDDEGARTDVVVLGCTHYPLLLPRFERLAPWPVTWLDPAPAIARRIAQLLGVPSSARRAERRGGGGLHGRGLASTPALRGALAARGLPQVGRSSQFLCEPPFSVDFPGLRPISPPFARSSTGRACFLRTRAAAIVVRAVVPEREEEGAFLD